MMGADFLEKTQGTLKRSWSKQRIRLSERDLFTQEPMKVARTVLAEILGQESVVKGEQFTVEKVGDHLVGRRGHCDVLVIEKPPAETLKALSRVLKDSQRIGKMIHFRILIRELDNVWQISIGSDCEAAGSP